MEMINIIGRKEECYRLNRCLEAKQAQLVIVYGRRRVGKTFLINSFFENTFAFKLTGAYKQPKNIQLKAFAMELSRHKGEKQKMPGDWMEAFNSLRNYLEELPTDRKQVVFLDEMPWLDTAKSGFLPAFEWFWNDWGSAQKNLIFIVCGSATTWMVNKIADNKGGLFNRQSCRLYLEPFTLAETEQYLKSINIEWSRLDIAECYMIMGGIPYYLSLLDPQLSYMQNIDHLFFKKNGELWDEFDHLYRTLFTGSGQYIRIAEVLCEKRYGMSRKEIAQAIGVPENGVLSTMLKNLEFSGFIRVSNSYGKKKREARYQLTDYYSCFYFRFIKANYGKDAHFWSNSADNPARRAWAGLTFECLCRDHVRQIKQKLGISGVLTEESVWSCQPDENTGRSGAQVDLLIDRRDRVVNLCEIKFSINPFEIDKDYDLRLREKISSFVQATGCRKTIQPTLITTYGVKNNKYSGGVSSQVVLNDLFAE